MIKKSVFATTLLIFAIISNSQAQSIAVPGKYCSGDIAIPKLNCINPEGGDDVRLYIMEFQDCNNGQITKLDRSIMGLIFSEPSDASESAKVSVEFSNVRTHFDDRVNQLTMILPKSAIIRTKNTTVTMTISDKIAPNYEGADIAVDWHYSGSFNLVRADGTNSEGRLACFVNH